MSRRVSLRIRYDRRSGLVGLLTLALLVAALLGYLAWGRGEVAASGPQAPFDHAQAKPLAASTGMRQYYLTTNTYNGDGADGAGVCATGYHFASMWEIADPSNLKYNTDLGSTEDDSGQGPPSFANGWVRTGSSSNTEATEGRGNCNAWTSSDSGHRGTVAWLPTNWNGTYEGVNVWDASTRACSQSQRVWCVADDVGGAPVYLPLILRNSS